MLEDIINLTKEDGLFFDHIEGLIVQQEWASAVELIQTRLDDSLDLSIPNNPFIKTKLAGLLIDIGSGGLLEEPIKHGIDIYEKDIDIFAKHVHRSSIEYSLGNGKSGLFSIQRTKPGFRFNPKNIDVLTEAKNHYWRAYKLLRKTDIELKMRLLTNLANTLDTSGRIVESLQYYDQVIKNVPGFPNANAGRAEALIWLNEISGSLSINQVRQAINNLTIAITSTDVPDRYVNHWKSKRDSLQYQLEKIGYTETDVVHDLNLTKKESDSHSNYRKFCLDHYLCLSEHSLYCRCIGADRDNLTIPKASGPIGGKNIPIMELRLNRIKSEYALARLLFYESRGINQKRWEAYNKELIFTDLYEDEAVGHRPEMLRTSFRLCFGILDKIAHALCEFFDLSDPNEPLSFERFWRPRGKKLSKKQQERWEKINQIENFAMIALYSQASDLNSVYGEWGAFKKWRNALEHESLILTKFSDKPMDIYGVLKGSSRVLIVNYEEFQSKTLQLLQLARSAIFNFVFCVRMEGEKDLQGLGKSVSITLFPKDEAL